MGMERYRLASTTSKRATFLYMVPAEHRTRRQLEVRSGGIAVFLYEPAPEGGGSAKVLRRLLFG